MRLLKIVILALMLLAIALFGASYQLPLQIEVEQSMVLDAKPEQVYTLLANPTEWEQWNPVNTNTDPSMIRMYSGPMAGSGARMQWSGDKVGTGEVVFTESVSPERLTYTQSDKTTSEITKGSFLLEQTEGGNTKLLWQQTATVKDEPIARLVGAWQKYKKQEEIDKGLTGLQNIILKRAAKPTSKRRVAYR
ncbi:SRPBCC family protein [Pontibacter sp. H249]|uniref:SRPBCC family protein n=1 Tax=Pontibacter sp. H249 TaxID=3133420 RepID=UPI0030C2148D